jgi:AhpD family alkylhydroperoxidase
MVASLRHSQGDANFEGDHMPDYRVHTIESASEASRSLLEETKRHTGMISNFQFVMAESPTTLEMYSASAHALAHGRLSRTERELVAIAVSVEHRCDYCVASHSTAAARQKVPSDVIAAARDATPLAETPLDDPVADQYALIQRHEPRDNVMDGHTLWWRIMSRL